MARGFIYLELWDKKCGNMFSAVEGGVEGVPLTKL